MTKLHLLNTTTGQAEAFDTVDAKEILEAPGSIYTLLDPQPLSDSPLARARRAAIDIPQVQSEQPGTSKDQGIAKYARQAVTKGVS